MSFLRCDSSLDAVLPTRSLGASRHLSFTNELGSRPCPRAPTINGFTRRRFSEPNAAHRLLQHITTREHTREVRSSPALEAVQRRSAELVLVPPTTFTRGKSSLRRTSRRGANHRDVPGSLLTTRADSPDEPRNSEMKDPFCADAPPQNLLEHPLCRRSAAAGVGALAAYEPTEDPRSNVTPRRVPAFQGSRCLPS